MFKVYQFSNCVPSVESFFCGLKEENGKITTKGKWKAKLSETDCAWNTRFWLMLLQPADISITHADMLEVLPNRAESPHADIFLQSSHFFQVGGKSEFSEVIQHFSADFGFRETTTKALRERQIVTFWAVKSSARIIFPIRLNAHPCKLATKRLSLLSSRMNFARS